VGLGERLGSPSGSVRSPVTRRFLVHFRLKRTFLVITRMHGSAIMENSTPCKYKTVKDIEKPFGIYHYVGESSCCAKIYRNWITHFGWQIGDFFSFFYLQTHTQTNNFFHLAYRSQIWTELNALTLIIRGFRCRCAFWGSRRRSIIFRGPDPQKPKFLGRE